MKIVKIVTPLGNFQVGKEKVEEIIRQENRYLVFRKVDEWNVGTRVEVKCDNVLVFWE